MAQSGKDIFKRVKPQLRVESTYICLRPDLLERWAELSAELADMESTGTKRMNGPAAVKGQRAKAEELHEVELALEETQVEFTFQAMPIWEFSELKAGHPPRKDDQLDAYVGYNRDAVMDLMVRACLIDPVFEDCERKACDHTDCGSWQQFLRVCNPQEWAELRDTMNYANRSVVESPKSALASQILGRRGSGSKRPESGESPRDASTAGSRKKSTSTTTPTES